jgi:hypothetical protein
MKPVVMDQNLVAYCGLYCGACKSYLTGKCNGCQKNEKATWCKIRTCCNTNAYSSCADCSSFVKPNDCKKFNNFISKIFAFIFKSDRAACIEQIKAVGIEGHARKMSENKLQSIKRAK